jgi:hypothetical protein
MASFVGGEPMKRHSPEVHYDWVDITKDFFEAAKGESSLVVTVF